MKHLQDVCFERTPRRGSILIIAVLCLVLATSIVGVLLSLVQKQRRQIAFEQAQVQAEWLAESGIDRAVFRLRGDHAYEGETWMPGSSDLAGEESAEVMIEIQKSTDRPSAYAILVKAVYGSGPGQSVTRTRQTTVEFSQEI